MGDEKVRREEGEGHVRHANRSKVKGQRSRPRPDFAMVNPTGTAGGGGGGDGGEPCEDHGEGLVEESWWLH